MSAKNLVITPSPVPSFTRLRSAIRSAVVARTFDNPLYWNKFPGKRYSQADIEGPFYMLNAPELQFEKGKAILASVPILEKSRPFLMTVRVLSPEGSPIPGAVLDWWQADAKGNYYSATYTLRGRITTDDQGYAEVLTVVPGGYGVAGAMRSGHFHLWIHAPPARPGKEVYDDLTTQLYICDANDVHVLDNDIVNRTRGRRDGNMVQAWSIPDSNIDEGRPYMNFPELPYSDQITRRRVEWWDSKLAEVGAPGLKVTAGFASMRGQDGFESRNLSEPLFYY